MWVRKCDAKGKNFHCGYMIKYGSRGSFSVGCVRCSLRNSVIPFTAVVAIEYIEEFTRLAYMTNCVRK